MDKARNMNQENENIPPLKRMKQATLTFFKSSPTPGSSSGSKTKKRKNPGSVTEDSPNKTAKLGGKPFVHLAEPPNSPSKQAKGCKAYVDQSINDHEVSSSSEADSGTSVKSSNGKCCLMERFVCKLPKEGNQEISSTNDVIDESVDVCNDKNEKDNKESGECCIVVDDDSAQGVTEEHVRASDKNAEKDEEKPREVILCSDGSSCPAKESVGQNEEAKQHASTKSPLASQTKPEPEACELSNEHLDTSVNENSFISGSEVVSTPCKPVDEKDVTESGAESSFLSDIAVFTPNKETEAETGSTETNKNSSNAKTPASGKKRGRKVDLGKKAEKEAEKQRLKEEKEQQRSAKKRKLEEEKAEKERLRKETKEAKEKEKLEQKEKLQREKEVKEKAKEEERKKKEEDRLLKEEERKKKQAAIDAKQEEKRKKEEERKQREEEKLKEEEEKKKKAEKVKQAFQSFFIKPKDNIIKPVTSKPTQGTFVPFEVKKDMYLAPTMRRDALSEQTKNIVDKVLENPQSDTTNYLMDLKNKKVIPHKTGRVLRRNPEPPEDIEIVHDPEALKKVQHKVKLLQFHTDNRPPYYGTWQKNPQLSARNPWKKDESMFDYEVDSDDEWEEEEPGESLSCSDGEEEKGEKGEEDEDDEEDGWMVPHGYLSEDEGCNEDDEITPEKLKLQQLAKAKAWEEEQKRKLQAAPLIAVGCFFEHSPSPVMAGDVRLLYEFRGMLISPCAPIPTGLFGWQEQEAEEAITPDKNVTTPSQRGCPRKAVPDEAMPDLIRLVHGNTCGIKRLIRDFRIFWLKKESPESHSEPTTSKDKLDESLQDKEGDGSFLNDTVQEKEDEGEGKQSEGNPEEKKKEEGTNCSISKRQLDIKINAIAVRDKRPGFYKTCWYVHDTVLKEFDLADLVCNSLIPTEPMATTPCTEEPVAQPLSDQRSIMDFALSKEELAKKESSLPRAAENLPAKTPQGHQKSIMDFARSKEELTKADNVLPRQIQNNQAKTPQRDQKSIMDFTLSKEELVIKKEAMTKKVAENSLQPLPTTHTPPKDSKKIGGQMSIMTFARVAQGKSAAVKDTKKIPTKSTDNTNVIIIDSDVEMNDTGDISLKPSLTSSSCGNNTSLSSINEPQIHLTSIPSHGFGQKRSNPDSSDYHGYEIKECYVKVEKLQRDIRIAEKK